MYHTIIVGAGPSGLQCAATLAFDGHKVLLLDGGSLGGQILNSPLIENVIGHPALIPYDWAIDAETQLIRMGVKYCVNTPAQHIRYGARGFEVYTPLGSFMGMTVVIAVGCSPHPLNVEGSTLPHVHYGLNPQEDTVGGRTVVVVGGANAAGTVAMHLSKCGNKVFLLHRDRLSISRGISDMWEDVEAVQGTVLEIAEAGRTMLVYTSNGPIPTIDDVYVMAGRSPNTMFADRVLQTDTSGYAFADLYNGRTYHDGVFACGNCVRNAVRTMGAAIGSGTNVANAVREYINGNER